MHSEASKRADNPRKQSIFQLILRTHGANVKIIKMLSPLSLETLTLFLDALQYIDDFVQATLHNFKR